MAAARPTSMSPEKQYCIIKQSMLLDICAFSTQSMLLDICAFSTVAPQAKWPIVHKNE